MRRAASILALLALLPWTAAADLFIVDYDGLTDYERIQDAIDAASDGDEIQVLSFLSSTAVTFSGPGNTNLEITGKNLHIWAPEGPDQTIIDGGGASRAFLFAGVDSTTVVEGFTFRDCNSSGDGGAIQCFSASPRVADCVFEASSAAGGGGALRLSSGATRVTNCVFRSNSAGLRGGAVDIESCDVVFERCTFSGNECYRGGAIFVNVGDVSVRRCTLVDNDADTGSSLRVGQGSVTIEQSILAFGGSDPPLFLDNGSAETFYSCVFGNSGGDSLAGDSHDNLFVDPLICDLYGTGGGSMSLCSNSPCLSANNAWHLPIGSKAQGCSDCDSPVTESSWGSIKALFR